MNNNLATYLEKAKSINFSKVSDYLIGTFVIICLVLAAIGTVLLTAFIWTGTEAAIILSMKMFVTSICAFGLGFFAYIITRILMD